MSNYRLIRASAHQTGLEAKSVHAICTSPPYFGLRAYDGDQGIEWPEVSYSPMPGLAPLTIQGCDPECKHEWGELIQVNQRGTDGDKSTLESSQNRGRQQTVTQGAYCIHCGGWRGPLGLEPTIEAYIGHLILVAREMYRVLRDDSCMFFNLGDSYNNRAVARPSSHQTGLGFISEHLSTSWADLSKAGRTRGSQTSNGLKEKDLMMIPARFALAAQADGWYLRSAMPWIKRNGMPESVTDRPAQTIESVFILAKSERYFWDGEAVKMPVAESSIGRLSQDIENQTGTVRANGGAKTNGNLKAAGNLSGRNLRASDLFFRTWEGLLTSPEGDPLAMVINPRPYSGAHFAVFPELLPELAIKAATSAYGCCPECGAQWRRVVEKERAATRPGNPIKADVSRNDAGRADRMMVVSATTTGWAPGCTCPDAGEVQPATVLDPFSGSGTTARVALRLGRNAIGVDLADSYLDELAPERLSNVQMEMQL